MKHTKTKILSGLHKLLFDERYAAIHTFIQFFTMLSWMVLLIQTKAHYVVYLLVGLCGLYCFFVLREKTQDIFVKENRLNLLIASVFSLFIMGGNYDLFSDVPTNLLETVLELLFFPLLFVGGMFQAAFILQYLTKKLTSFTWNDYAYSWKPAKVFLVVWLSLSAFYAAILFLCFYPGIISPDSVVQVEEGITHHYTNRHPFFHTMLIKLFISIGVRFFHDINVGVALYSVFSILFLSASFAYGIVTLYQLHIHKNILIGVFLFYLLLPHHIVFSFTMWKDVLFGASILLFTVSLFRWMEKIGEKQWIDKVVVYLGSLGICFFRGNGLIVLFIFSILFAVWFGKSHPKRSISFACLLVGALIITYPVLNACGVTQSDTVELLCMPIQQIARTVVDGKDLTDEQEALLSEVVDINEIPHYYSPIIADPMKVLVRGSGNKEYINQHPMAFVRLYFQLGLAHPDSYAKAWIDQTKGYWNAGYSYWLTLAFEGNTLGMKRTVASHFMERVCDSFLLMYQYVDIIKPFVSMGLYLWIILLVAFIGYRKKNKLTICLTIPSLAVIYTLLIGTPVYSEYRYAYCLFCCTPFLFFIAFRRHSDCSDDSKT